MLKKILLSTSALILLFCLVNFQAIRYGIYQGIGQLKMVQEAKPITEYLSDAAFPDSLKHKLRLVEEIKTYCKDSLGLESGDNYTELFDQKGEPGMWVVTGAHPFKLEPYQWSFPFLGEFSYKGYFKKEKAVDLQNELIQQGYDTDLAEVNAWSTLGWFKDPVMSSMLEKPEALLARVLIHEITHYNVFVKDDITYNENLASFIGDIGAEKFLLDKYGPDHDELILFKHYLKDIQTFTRFMVRKSNELNAFYTDSMGLDSLQNVKKKSRKINEILSNLKNEDFKGKELIEKIIADSSKINNTFFTDFLTYKEKNDSMELDFKHNYNSQVILYIEAQKKKYGI